MPAPGADRSMGAGGAGPSSPVDNIYTHYPVEEQLAKGTGRFGDEAQRLSQIFARGTRTAWSPQ